MADNKIAGEENFLGRWARRKADASKPAADDTLVDTPEVQMASLKNAALARPHLARTDDDNAETPEIDLATLPDVDSLDEESDFSLFMQNGIPEELQNRALQKLWRLDPSFGHIDGLLEYGEDFTGTGLAAEVVNTIYKVGKGMMTDEEEADEIRRAADESSDSAPSDTATPDTDTSLPADTAEAPLDSEIDTADDDRDVEKQDTAGG